MLSIVLIYLASFIGYTAQAKSPQPASLMIAVYDDQGAGKLSFAPRNEPYTSTARPQASYKFWDHQDIVDKDGQAVTGLSFYAWKKDQKITVVVFTMVPAPGSPNRYLARNGDDTAKLVQLKDMQTLTLTAGQAVSIDRMKEIGLKPFTVKVE